MATVHANSAQDALTKICTLPLLAGENISRQFIVPTVASCIDLVVHCTREEDGSRHVQEIMSIGGRVEGETIETSTVFSHQDGELRPTSSAVFDHPKLTSAARARLQRLGAER